MIGKGAVTTSASTYSALLRARDERDRFREALEDIEARLGPHRERLSSQQAKDAYDIAATALNQPGPAEPDTRKEPS